MNLRKDHSHIMHTHPTEPFCERQALEGGVSHCHGLSRGNVASSFVNGSGHNNNSQFSAMDVSVRSTMKGAAKCDKHCELQNSVNRQGLERILCFRDIPESTPDSASMLCYSNSCSLSRGMLLRVLVPQDARAQPSCSRGAPEASDRQGLAASTNWLSASRLRCCARRGGRSCCLLGLAHHSPSSQDMKLGWQTR